MEFKECQSCPGYCCVSNSVVSTPLTEEDIIRISKYFKTPIDIFRQNFVVYTKRKIGYASAPDAVAHIRSRSACPFLRQGLCGINHVKPKACREMKPLHLKGISCADWHRMRVGL
jgi:Fe-S-cluster containining protein